MYRFMTENTQPITLHVTANAQEQLKALLTEQKKPLMVRLYVVGGIYPTVHMNLDTQKPTDEKVEQGGVAFLIDAFSRSYLDGATVDCINQPEGPTFKITGPNVPEDEGPKASASEEGPAPAPGSQAEREAKAKKALKKVFDPEIPMNIVDLGLIYGMEWKKDGTVNIKMTMTSPGCPVIEMLAEEVKTVVDEALGAHVTQVEVVWEPPWGPERMSEYAKRQFGYA
jgi:metal-sulfur cluster biosynthetic enzyme/Fe-S cluster assembly iron-binding protein IscA